MQEDNLQKKTVKNMFWKFGERITSQIVSLIVSIVLARILLPEDYGIVALCMVFITICDVFVSSGFGSALIQKKDADELDFSSVFYASVAISVILYLILFFLAKPISTFYSKYSSEKLTLLIQLLGLRLPIAAMNSVQQAYVSKKMIFKKFFLSSLFGTLFSGVVGIVLAYNGFGVYALVAQYLINSLINTIVLFITVKWRPKWMFSFARIKSLLSFGWKMLVSGLLNTGYNQLRSLIIGKKYSPEDLALYDRGNQFPSLIATNINSTIDGVLFPIMSDMQDNPEQVKSAVKKSISVSSYIMFPLMVGLAVVAEPLVKIILTEKWLGCVPFLQMMCFVYAFWPIHTANLQAIKAMGRSDLFLTLEVIKSAVGIGILLATMWFGVIWIAIGGMISTVVSTAINSFPNRKLLNYKYLEQILDILPSFLIACLMGGIVYLITLFKLNAYLTIAIQVVLGAGIYIGLSILFKIKPFKYVLNMLKNFKKKPKAEEK